MSADRMADCTQKLQAPLYNCDKQDLIRSLIVQHVQFFLGTTDVQPVAVCLVWCRVVQSRDVHPCDMMRCQVSRFQRPHRITK